MVKGHLIKKVSITSAIVLLAVALIILAISIYVTSFGKVSTKLEAIPTPTVQVTPTASPSGQVLPQTKKAVPVQNNVLSLVNTQRIQRGLKPLTYNSAVASGAQTRAKNLALSGQWSHAGLAQALWNAGLRGYYSENLAKDFNSDQEVVTGWVNSPTHAEKMFDSRCTIAGVGQYGKVVVLWMGVCGQ